jgi:hypothetical protein
MRLSQIASSVLALAALAACESPVSEPSPLTGPQFSVQAAEAPFLLSGGGGDLASVISDANEALAASGSSLAISQAEWIDGAGDTDAAKTVFANDRMLRLDSRWVPGDPRRGATGTDLTQGSFTPFQIADGVLTEPIVDAAFSTWEGLRCSDLGVNKVGFAPGVFPSAILGLSGHVNDPLAADISTVGWLPGFLFDLVLGPGASASVLGVAFTFVWTDGPGGPPTDVDADGRNDTALKEIWYNDAFVWTDTGSGGIDVETVALHENGHALELGHFGKLTSSVKKGVVKIQASPRAVMNATYLGPFRSPRGTDNAAFCGNFASWPNT